MVSKVTIIALVAILACPILLGYGLNFNEVTETEYRPVNDPVNVTPLLQNGTAYSYLDGDVYQLNSNFVDYPYYSTLSDIKSSFPMQRANYNGHPVWGGAAGIPVSTFDYIYYQTEGNTTLKYVTFTLKDDNGNVVQTFTRFHSLTYGLGDTSKIYVTYYTADDSTNLNRTTISNINSDYRLILSSSSYTGTGFVEFIQHGQSTTYVNMADGFYFKGNASTYWQINLPEYTKGALLTINLDSITAPNQITEIIILKNTYYLTKSTTNGVVSFTLTKFNSSLNLDLYYDSKRTDNTYQIYIDYQEYSRNSSYMFFSSNVEFRYVGGWPNTFGEANVYRTYTDYVRGHTTSLTEPAPNFKSISFTGTTQGRTPTMRIDNAKLMGTSYDVINSQVFVPSDFKTNPITKIENVNRFGSAIQFGGNIYTVSDDGNITLGTHKIPVNNLIFSSTPANGVYENKIGNTVVSTSATPSTITFSGIWAMSVSTDSTDAVSYTKTEWVPGEFAWNGIDDNFLIVGLLTSLGAFIGLAIYSRRSRTSLWPLLIVCGCASLLFLFML